MGLSTQAGRAVGELSRDARSAEHQGTRVVSPVPRPGLDRIFLALLALGVIVRGAYALQYHVCFGDESCYLYLAQNLFGGQGYTYYNHVPELHFPPFFPIVLGLLHCVVPDWEIVSRVAYVVFGSLLLLPVYLLARRIYGVLVARIATLILALLPALTSGVLFAETLSEPLYLFCLACGIYQLYLAFTDGTVRSHVLTGIAFSLAYLTRPEAMLYFFLALGSLPIYWVFQRRYSFRQAAVRLVVLAAGFFVIAFPYLVFVRHEVGTWTLSTKGRTTYLTTRALVPQNGKVDTASFLRDTWGLDEKGEVRYFAHEFDQRTPFLLLSHRDRLLPDIQANLGLALQTLYRRSFLGQHLLALAVVGLVSSFLWRGRSFRPEVFHCLLLTPLTAFLLFFIKERYFYPAFIPIVIWMACGIEALLHVIEQCGRFPLLAAPWRRRALQAVVLCLLAAFLVRAGHQVFVRRSMDQPDITALTQAIERHTLASEPVVCAYPQFAFHAERRWLPLPVATLEEVRRYATLRGASCIAIADWRLDARPEEQRRLVDSPSDRPGLELLEASSGTLGPDFAIYRIKG
jgi:4-amino-4-deoxy-L-arabinose transferase-like glycosyltransferase